jgi:hypothetical protein
MRLEVAVIPVALFQQSWLEASRLVVLDLLRHFRKAASFANFEHRRLLTLKEAHMKTARVTAVLVLIVGSGSALNVAQAQERPPIFQQMFKTYGLEAFSQIERIRYTYNLELPALNLSRTWEWEPKADLISYEGKDKNGATVKLTYPRSQLSSQTDVVKNEIDPAFTNDNYMLLFLLHVSWDGGAKVTDEGMHKLPLGNGSAQRVVVRYPAEGGYAPGDTWELYVDADHRVDEFVYHGGGPGIQKRPSVLIATWAGYKKAGPLLISTDHRGTADGRPVRIFFSDVSVKVTGSDSWMNAQ